MKKNKFALQIASFSLILLSFIACDKDFAVIESDIINDDVATNFDILKLSETSPEFTEIITYTDALEPVQTNGLGLNTLGIYDDSYGRTSTNFVTQVTTSTFNPDFGNGVSIDSVVLTMPYFGSATDIDDDGNITYEIDSVIGRNDIKLSLFESNYFIRDFDPNAEFNDSQSYFSNKSASATETISEAILEGEELIFLEAPETSHLGNNIIDISDEGFVLTALDDEDEVQISQRQFPGMRIKLDTTFWREKIIDKEGDAVLSSANNFEEYFRGIYFKAESVNNNGSFLILNTGALTSNIVIYYTRLTASTTDEPEETEQATFELRFGPSRINFIDNDFVAPIIDGDPINGDSRLFLKGGEGSIGRIKLFNGEDLDGDDTTLNPFEIWKNDFVETDADGKFVKSKRLVNEAHLVFYVDQDAVNTQNIMQDGEPNRIYLYDIDNKLPLTDFFIDGTNNALPSFSKFSHLGPLQREGDEPTGDGVKYKLKITEHINNLLLRDSTNVELGLSVSINVNLEELLVQREVQTTDGSDFSTPISSIITPRGTVLHGNNTEDDSKKVYLEIYYTEPNN